MKSRAIKSWSMALLLIVTVAFFQNCSPSGFEALSLSENLSSGSDSTNVAPTPTLPYQEDQLQLEVNNSLIENIKNKQVYQRQASNNAVVNLQLRSADAAVKWVTINLTSGDQNIFSKNYEAKDVMVAGGNFRVPMTLKAGGWYQVKAAQVTGTKIYTATQNQFGVGDIYVIAGQSNAANHAQTMTVAQNSLVVMYDPANSSWKPAKDPLPFASVFSLKMGYGNLGRGSTWPLLGDLLAAQDKIPIAFLSTAVGGTPLSRWQPNAQPFVAPYNEENVDTNFYLYSRLLTSNQKLVNESGGFKMILWHQGESDLENCSASNVAACDSVLYESRFLNLKSALDRDLGRNVNWMVAQVSFFPAQAADYMASGAACKNLQNLYPFSASQMILSQRNLWKVPGILQGPSSDDLLEDHRFSGPLGGCVHLSLKGQQALSQRWLSAILSAR